MRRLPLVVAFALSAGSLRAQTAESIAKAAETIAAADVARHIGVIADDSMGGRSTPSPGLEKTARYVADQFKQLGLKPGGDNRTWFQRYPYPDPRRRLDFGPSRVVFTAAGKEVAASLTAAAYLEIIPRWPVLGTGAGVVLVAGRHTVASVQQVADSVRGKVILYVPPAGVDSVTQRQVLSALVGALASADAGLVILTAEDSARFAARVQAKLQEPTGTTRTSASWVGQVWPPAVQAALTAGGLDLVRARADTAPVVRTLPKLTARVDVKWQGEPAIVPNVVGILEGSDPKLKDEYIVFSAHMDHIGIRRKPGETDSINNGADDNASGTAGLIELAQAFVQPGARPRRSLIFLAVSGEESGMLGSDYFVAQPPVPFRQLVANVNLDMIGRSRADTVTVKGGLESELGAIVSRIASAHPEFRLTIRLQDPSGLSDYARFHDRGIPILYFLTGTWHPDYHQVTDSPEKINADAEARILRLVFYVVQEMANADQRPKGK